MQDKNSQNKGNEFWNVVQNAINTGDYHELSDKVKQTVNVTADEIRNIKDDFMDSFFGMGISIIFLCNRTYLVHYYSRNSFWYPVF